MRNNGGLNIKKVRSGKIKIAEIKHLINSRMQGYVDVKDLKDSIRNVGLMEPIGIRSSDNAVIYGNRRLKACMELGHKEIDCDFWDDVSDNEIMILNVTENMKRKNITTVELGRICLKLRKNGMTDSEIANKLGVIIDRIERACNIYQRVMGTAWEKAITFDKRNSGDRYIPETVMWKVQQNLQFMKRELNDKEWDQVLKAISQGILKTHNARRFAREILGTNKKMSVKRALEALQDCEVATVTLLLNKDKRKELAKKYNTDSNQKILQSFVEEHDPLLLFGGHDE